MEVNFKYEIGEIITTKESLFAHMHTDPERGKTTIPIILTVISRHMEQCPGGTQLHYICSYYTAQGYKADKFNEIQLLPHPKAVRE